jgi:glycerol-3-phosphate dehydrogenase (NAD(P)+)
MFGAGSWGTALAVLLAEAGHDVTLWARRPEAAARMRQTRHNPTYLPEVTIPDSVRITSDLEEAAQSASVWAVAIPTQAVRSVAEKLAPFAHPDLLVVSLAKGIENHTLKVPTQVLAEVFASVPADRIGVLHGPSHAEEVAEGRPTTVVAAAPTESTAEAIQSIFMTDRLRVYVNTDVIGVEVGGAVKNVLALAAGMGDGLGYGDNSKAAIVTRGIAEIRRLGIALGADPSTFAGLAGIGDLVVTCMSEHSRNRYFGEQVGRGRSLEEVEASMDMIAEGVRTTESVHDLAQQLHVEMPITEAVYAILFEGKDPEQAVHELMTREAKREHWLPEVLEDEM